MAGKLIIFSAPSGSGKSTIINYLMRQGLNLSFSISATSRPPRGTERDGVEYFFLSPDEFKKRIANGDFLEYEEVYTDRFYGTLKSQVEKQLAAGDNVVFDVDVKGGCRIKDMYGDRALSMFIHQVCGILFERILGRHKKPHFVHPSFLADSLSQLHVPLVDGIERPSVNARFFHGSFSVVLRRKCV